MFECNMARVFVSSTRDDQTVADATLGDASSVGAWRNVSTSAPCRSSRSAGAVPQPGGPPHAAGESAVGLSARGVGADCVRPRGRTLTDTANVERHRVRIGALRCRVQPYEG